VSAEQVQAVSDDAAFILGYFRQYSAIAGYVAASEDETFRPPDWMPSQKMEAIRAEDLRRTLKNMPSERSAEIMALARSCVAESTKSSQDVNLLN
jgi:hypothetical protein